MSDAKFKGKIDQFALLDDMLAKTHRTISFDVEKQIKEKYKTFTRFNYREVAQEIKVTKKKRENQIVKVIEPNLLTSFIMGALEDLQKNKKKEDKNKKLVIEQLAGVKSQRRQRFKKAINSMQIIKHYIQKENFKPRQEELYLMKSLAELRDFSQQNNLDAILKKIYKFMNEAVDFNELRFLCLLIILAADICFQFHDLNRAFYFYNQARMFSSYACLYSIKTQALISLGLVASEVKNYNQSFIIFKKGLQYAWKTKNVQYQLLIYDLMGSCSYYQGKIKQAQYYHNRFSQGQYENNESAIKKISVEMLQEYEKFISSLQKKNLTSLFLQYINLPIVDLNAVPPPSQQRKRRIYENYDQQGLSPRRKKPNKKFQFEDFPDVSKQIEKLVIQDYQFKTQIPNPDVQRHFVASQKYGKPRKNISFQQSSQFHKIIETEPPKLSFDKLYCHSLEKRIEKVLSERQNPNWWSDMRDKIRKNQLQKVGQLKDRIRNSHESYSKYPQERRRSHSLKNQKIKQSFNKTLLDWIDPVK